MKLIGRTLLILFAFLSHYYISGSLNVKNILTQISKGDLTKEDVIKFYNKDFDPMLEFHKIFTPCLNHLIDQEMKTESFITNIIQSIKEFFSSSYQEYSIPELGMKIKCETYINKLVSPDFIEKKKVEVLDLKRKLLANAQASMKFRSKEESTVEAKNSKKDKLPLPGSNPHQKYSPNNKMKNNEINVENNGELKGVKLLKENDVQIPDLNGAEKIEYQVNPEKLFKDVLKNNKNKNKDITNSSICEKNLKKQKEINDLLSKDKDLLQKSLHTKSLEFTQVNDENCKCTEAKYKLESEITQCKNEKTELQIRNTKEKSNEEINKIRQNNPTSDETKSELITKIEEIRKLKEENIKCKQDLDEEKKKVSETKDALQAQKVLSEKLLKENSDKLFEEKDKIAKELKVCNEKLDKKDDSKDKTIENCTRDLQAKEQDVKNLNDKLKTCDEKITTKSDNNNNNKINDNGKSEFIISNNDVEDIKHEQVTPSSNTELAEITEKLKNCEEKNQQKIMKNFMLIRNITKTQNEMILLNTKLNSETAANLAKESEIKKLKEENEKENKLYKGLKEACDKKGQELEAQIKQLIYEKKFLNQNVTDCLNRERILKKNEKSCREKLTAEVTKVKGLENDKKTLEDICEKEKKKLIQENEKLNEDLLKEGLSHNKTKDDFNTEKNKREDCEGINKKIFADTEEKCNSRIKGIKEEKDSEVKKVRDLYENLNKTCTKDKKDLEGKVKGIAKDLSDCKVDSLKKYNIEHGENEKCKLDLIQEREDKGLNYIKKTDCDNELKTVKGDKTKLEAEIKVLKEKSLCPLCPSSNESSYKEKIDGLRREKQQLNSLIEKLKDEKEILIEGKTSLNNILIETEKQCKKESEKAAEEFKIKLQKEEEQQKRLTTQCDSDKKTLFDSKTELDAKLKSCKKDLEQQKQSCIGKELLDKCKKENKERGEKIGRFYADLKKCNREYKELINNKTKIELNEKNCLKKHEALETQLKIKGDEAEKYRKAQAERESECFDLVFEHKSKLQTQSNHLQSIRYSEEAKKTIIESYIKNLSNEHASDDKQLKNYSDQINEEIKNQRNFNEVLKESRKATDELEKQKAEIVAKIVNNNPKLSVDALKKLSHEIEIKDNYIKANKEIIKDQEFIVEKSHEHIRNINSQIADIEFKVKYNKEEKRKIELLLEPYNDIFAKVNALVDDNNLLRNKYNKTAETVLKEAVKAGNANEKFEKIFADYSQKLAGLEAIIATSSAKFKEDLKTISDRMDEEKSKCLTELKDANIAKDAKCFVELDPILQTIKDINKKIICNTNNVTVDNNNNNKDGLGTNSGKSFNTNEINKNSPDLNSCLNLISDKMYTDNNCALLEPLRAKYNDLCRVNQLAPPNKDILSFATQPPKDGNKTMLKRLSTKKI